MTDTSRDRIVGLAEGSLSKTIYAGAGAGTGKTQALVERIANLVTTGGINPENIVAVTFTVAAASELRQRVREELEARLDAARRSGHENAAALSSALDSLDSAFIGTIHSFAQSLLRERPLDVDLPPVFELVDAVQSVELFDEAWDEWLDDALLDPEFASAIMNSQRLGLRTPLATLRDLAGEMHENYDIVERAESLSMPAQTSSTGDSLSAIRSDLTGAQALQNLCTNSDDRLLQHLEIQVAQAVSWIDEALSGNEEDRILALTGLPKLTVTGGRKPDWDPLPAGESSLEQVRALLKGAQVAVESGRKALGETTVVPLVNAVSCMVVEYAEKRRREGQLEFHDLLVLSCQMLSESDEARRYFQSRYTHILIDEFQDTDPLQLRLAILLADRSGNGRPSPGSLFVVGDAKQSIYRFRRADLTQLQGLIDSLGAETESLSTNYRSHAEILEWVNAVFGSWMGDPAGQAEATRGPYQAEYEALEPGRHTVPEVTKPRVMIAQTLDHANVQEAREAEAEELARLAVEIGSGSWNLPDPTRPNETRKSSYRDLCVLMPRRTSLPTLETAFAEHQVPYVLEGQAPVFESQVIHELRNNLVAIDDPTDQVAVVGALKSAAWGCSDQDLYDWATTGRKFEYSRDRIEPGAPELNPGARKVAVALAGLAEFHDLRQQLSAPHLIEMFVRQRRLREIGALLDPSGDRERLIDLFIEMSRSLQMSASGSLREFIRWISRQAEANTRVAEGALSSSELNAVRVMTIHAAKGLEFPIVALTGLQIAATGPRSDSIIREESGKPVVSVRLGARELGLSTPDFQGLADQHTEADRAELVRLAYVGATRAREYLVVSVHRTSRQQKTMAGRISEHAESSLDLWKPLVVDRQARSHGVATSGTAEDITGMFSLTDRDDWLRGIDDAVHAASGRSYVTPSMLADHSMFEPEENYEKPEDNSESTAWNAARKGRGGTDVGSAVHAVLQDVDFSDAASIDQLVRNAIDAYKIPEEFDNVYRLVINVLSSPTVARATAENCWREAWVAAEVADGVEVEGSIDLIIRNDDETVTILDYKTDSVSGEQLARRAKGYEPQLAGYALVVEKLGMAVREAVLVFADGGESGGAFEYVVADLDAAQAVAMEKAQQVLG